VLYTGNARGHAYRVEVRHRLLDTSAVVEIDGVRHVKTEGAPTADGIELRWDDRFTGLRIRVERPQENGGTADAELIDIRTTALGGAGEVDVTTAAGIPGTPLAPEQESPSAARDERKTRHPLAYAALAALRSAARFLVPLLGIGALLGGILEPVRRWVEDLVEPVVTWMGELLRPLGEFRDAVWDFLFGWIDLPSFSFDLPSFPDVPDRIFDVLPFLVVAVVFVSAYRGIRRRRDRLAEQRKDGGSDQELGDDGAEGR
jgi:hypothetical protein